MPSPALENSYGGKRLFLGALLGAVKNVFLIDKNLLSSFAMCHVMIRRLLNLRFSGWCWVNALGGLGTLIGGNLAGQTTPILDASKVVC